MSFFPSDWDDDFEDGFESFHGDLNKLAQEFESRSRDSFSARELLELFKHYTVNAPLGKNPFLLEKYAKMVVEIGVQSFPYMPIFTLHMVELLIQEGKHKKALRYIEQSLEYNAFESTLLMMRAIVYAHEGARKNAFDALDEALQSVGLDDQILEDFLDMVMHYDQIDLAEPIAAKAIEAKAEIIPIFEKYLNKNDDHQIVKMMIPAINAQIDNDPYMSEAWYLLGVSYAAIEEHSKAIEAFDYAVTIKEDFSDAWMGYIESEYELQNYSSVVEKFEDLRNKFGKEKTSNIEGLYAWSLHEVGRSEESRKVYKSLVKKSPEDSENWYSLGLTYHHDGEYGKAIPFLEKAWSIDSLESDYGIVLASAYFGNHDVEKWSVLYKELSEQFPLEADIWLDWGLALYEIGEVEQSIEVTEQGIGHNPQAVVLLYRFAALLYLNGDMTAGLLLLEKALEFDFKEYETLFTFAPQLKKSNSILQLIAKYSEGSNNDNE